jgi:lysophospholipase L1-like esterase
MRYFMNSTSMKRKITFLSGLLIACVFNAWAQDTIVYNPPTTYSFIRNEVNIIHNRESLDPLFARMIELKETHQSKVTILHLGDSHIQADYFTSTTRTLLQQEFGNAGLGLTFPGRTARTNESPAIHSSSTGQWNSNRITNSQNTQPIGIAGTSLKTELAGNTIKIRTVNATPDYSFNRMKLFFQKDVSSYTIIAKDSTGRSLAFAGYFTDEGYPNVSKLVLPYSINQVQLETVQTLPSQKQFTLFGVSLENSNPGILYHIIGVNGAKSKHFIKSKELLSQTTVLGPELIIISLGTNEAVDHPNMDPNFDKQLNTLISSLKAGNPNAIILLTTPADFYKKRTRRNPDIQIIKNKIIEVANNNKLPYWDLHEVAGGNHSADLWKKEELMQPDGIHFSKKGYALQGYLLFEAIIKGYNEYVLHRHSKTH